MRRRSFLHLLAAGTSLSAAGRVTPAAGAGNEDHAASSTGTSDEESGVPPQSPDWWSRAEPHMGCLWTLTLPGAPPEVAQQASVDVFREIARLNLIFSDYEPASELNRLCAKAGRRGTVPVSPELFEILSLSHGISGRSGGLFDITLGPCVRLWRRSRRRGELPDAADIARARLRTGWESIILDAPSRAVRLEKPGMQLDLGGIAKGWTQDACLRLLREKYGLTCVLLDAAGEVAAGTPPPGRRHWRIAIATPAAAARSHARAGPEASAISAAVRIHSANVATSGDLHQFVEIGGIRYSHLIDPATGLGSTISRQGTIVAASGALADPLAKILCLAPAEHSLPLLQKFWPDVHARVAAQSPDGSFKVRQSSGFPD